MLPLLRPSNRSAVGAARLLRNADLRPIRRAVYRGPPQRQVLNPERAAARSGRIPLEPLSILERLGSPRIESSDLPFTFTVPGGKPWQKKVA